MSYHYFMTIKEQKEKVKFLKKVDVSVEESYEEIKKYGYPTFFRDRGRCCMCALINTGKSPECTCRGNCSFE